MFSQFLKQTSKYDNCLLSECIRRLDPFKKEAECIIFYSEKLINFWPIFRIDFNVISL